MWCVEELHLLNPLPHRIREVGGGQADREGKEPEQEPAGTLRNESY